MPAATDYDALTLELAQLIESRRVQGSPYVVGIDGINAAGKTTFATAFAEQLVAGGSDAHVVHVDDFHHPREFRYRSGHDGEAFLSRYIDFDRLVTDVLAPLRETRHLDVRLGLIDVYAHDAPLTRVFSLGPDSIVLVEGIFLLQAAMRQYFDLTIFLDISFTTSISRGRDRWRHLEPDETERRFRTKYLPGQELYMARHRPQAAADLVIDNEDPRRPRIRRRGGMTAARTSPQS